jgi:DNA ligase (NAD+)
LICPNNHCEGRQKEILVSFVSRESMNIMGVGDKAIYQLYDAGLIKYADSLYRLTKEDVLKLSGFAETSAVDMIDVITRSKSAYLNQLLKGFGIPDVGEGTAARLAAHFKTLQAVASATVEELSSVPDVGEATARSVVSYFTDMKDVVQYFIDNSIATEAKPSEKKSDLLKGFSMIMTGSSEILDRDDFKKWVPENGGKVVSSISKKTSHVVLCAEAGPKKVQLIKELQGQGVPIKVITDQEFLDMIG